MDIRLYNTLAHEIERFEPIDPPHVRMYNCGPTVYDYAHIGNFRAFVFADVLRRFLEAVGYDVAQVMNITDVGHMTDDQLADGGGQDKMEVAIERMKEAKKQGRAAVDDPNDPYQIAAFFTERFLEDARALRLKIADEQADHMPRATANITGMIDMIDRLIKAGHAYVTATEEGLADAVYFDIESFPDYGKLSGNTLEHLREGAGGRIIEIDQLGKRNPNDFLLWKADEAHIMKWPTPQEWRLGGAGYPGWHIECSTMALATHSALAGKPIATLDIHTGGEDNIFPHHECEIAQSSGATGEPFARCWLHTRFLLVEGEKMSKSKGNFFTARDLFARGVDPAALRYELLRTHYRSNMNFTMKGLEDADKAVNRLRQIAAAHEVTIDGPRLGESPVEAAFAEALADDLNVSKALGELFSWAGALGAASAEDVAALRRMDQVLGVLDVAAAPGGIERSGLTDEEITQRCRDMDAARAAKDYATSDAIRDELHAAGVEVRIGREGTTWRRRAQLD